jgi:hypothetical protein
MNQNRGPRKNQPHAERLKYLQQIGPKFENPNLSTEQLEQLTELLYDYREIFCSEVSQLPVSKLEPYKIEMKDNTVVRQKRYTMPLRQEEILDKYCDELLKSGVCERSQGPYNNNVLLIRKGSFDEIDPTNLRNWRLVCEYRVLNSKIADPPHRTLPDLSDIKEFVGRSRSNFFEVSISSVVIIRLVYTPLADSSPHFLSDQNP